MIVPATHPAAGTWDAPDPVAPPQAHDPFELAQQLDALDPEKDVEERLALGEQMKTALGDRFAAFETLHDALCEPISVALTGEPQGDKVLLKIPGGLIDEIVLTVEPPGAKVALVSLFHGAWNLLLSARHPKELPLPARLPVDCGFVGGVGTSLTFAAQGPACAGVLFVRRNLVQTALRSLPLAQPEQTVENDRVQAEAEQVLLIEACAAASYEANRIYCAAFGDPSQRSWQEAPEWQKQSARNGVAGALSGNTPAEQHASWLADKEAAGWKHGPVKDLEKKEHPCMVPYDKLPEAQKRKDALYLAVVRAMKAAVSPAKPDREPAQSASKAADRPTDAPNTAALSEEELLQAAAGAYRAFRALSERPDVTPEELATGSAAWAAARDVFPLGSAGALRLGKATDAIEAQMAEAKKRPALNPHQLPAAIRVR